MSTMESNKRKKIGYLFDDIDIFVKACAEFQNPKQRKASITTVAKELGISATGLIECFKRLRNEYGTALVKTHAKVSGIEITEAGKMVLERSGAIFDIYAQLKQEVIAKQHVNRFQEEVIKVSVSPYLLAHVFPHAAATFKPKNSNNFIKIECEEGYYTDKIIERISSKEIDFAVLWSYPEKILAVKNEPDLTCARASKSLKPIIAFGKNHEFFRELSQNKKTVIYIEDLADKTLFLLEPAHQALNDKIPHPDVASGAKRVTFTTIMSIIGSIRAGMQGAGILPAIYKDIDRYRRDGSLFFLPLESRDKKTQLAVEILYVFRGPQPKSWREGDLPLLKEARLLRLKKNSVDFLNYIDNNIIMELISESGWERSVKPVLPLAAKDIEAFHYAYHISPPKVGMSEPVWSQSNINLEFVESNGRGSFYRGTMDLCKPDLIDCHHYILTAELISNQVLCLKGFRTKGGKVNGNDECFIATFNFLSQSGDHLMGIVSGQDDEHTSPMVCTFVLSRVGPVAAVDLAYELQVMKNRTLIRSDIRTD